MNPAFRALQKRNETLERNNAAMHLTLQRMLYDLEMTESAGCAYAWELAQSEWIWRRSGGGYVIHHCPPDSAAVQKSFEAAVALGAAFENARNWLREEISSSRVFRETSVAAASKDPNMELETPFGRYSLRTLTAT